MAVLCGGPFKAVADCSDSYLDAQYCTGNDVCSAHRSSVLPVNVYIMKCEIDESVELSIDMSDPPSILEGDSANTAHAWEFIEERKYFTSKHKSLCRNPATQTHRAKHKDNIKSARCIKTANPGTARLKLQFASLSPKSNKHRNFKNQKLNTASSTKRRSEDEGPKLLLVIQESYNVGNQEYLKDLLHKTEKDQNSEYNAGIYFRNIISIYRIDREICPIDEVDQPYINVMPTSCILGLARHNFNELLLLPRDIFFDVSRKINGGNPPQKTDPILVFLRVYQPLSHQQMNTETSKGPLSGSISSLQFTSQVETDLFCRSILAASNLSTYSYVGSLSKMLEQKVSTDTGCNDCVITTMNSKYFLTDKKLPSLIVLARLVPGEKNAAPTYLAVRNNEKKRRQEKNATIQKKKRRKQRSESSVDAKTWQSIDDTCLNKQQKNSMLLVLRSRANSQIEKGAKSISAEEKKQCRRIGIKGNENTQFGLIERSDSHVETCDASVKDCNTDEDHMIVVRYPGTHSTKARGSCETNQDESSIEYAGRKSIVNFLGESGVVDSHLSSSSRCVKNMSQINRSKEGEQTSEKTSTQAHTFVENGAAILCKKIMDNIDDGDRTNSDKKNRKSPLLEGQVPRLDQSLIIQADKSIAACHVVTVPISLKNNMELRGGRGMVAPLTSTKPRVIEVAGEAHLLRNLSETMCPSLKGKYVNGACRGSIAAKSLGSYVTHQNNTEKGLIGANLGKIRMDEAVECKAEPLERKPSLLILAEISLLKSEGRGGNNTASRNEDEPHKEKEARVIKASKEVLESNNLNEKYRSGSCGCHEVSLEKGANMSDYPLHLSLLQSNGVCDAKAANKELPGSGHSVTKSQQNNIEVDSDTIVNDFESSFPRTVRKDNNKSRLQLLLPNGAQKKILRGAKCVSNPACTTLRKALKGRNFLSPTISGMTSLPISFATETQDEGKELCFNKDNDILLVKGILRHGDDWDEILNDFDELQQLTLSTLIDRTQTPQFQLLLERCHLDAAILDDPGALFDFRHRLLSTGANNMVTEDILDTLSASFLVPGYFL